MICTKLVLKMGISIYLQFPRPYVSFSPDVSDRWDPKKKKQIYHDLNRWLSSFGGSHRNLDPFENGVFAKYEAAIEIAMIDLRRRSS
jgi:hypothetical protein